MGLNIRREIAEKWQCKTADIRELYKTQLYGISKEDGVDRVMFMREARFSQSKREII